MFSQEMINHVLRCPLLTQRVQEKGQERLIFPFPSLCLWYRSFQHQKQEDAGTFRGRETSRSQCFYRSFMMFGEFCLQENKRRTGCHSEGPSRGQGPVFEDRAEEPACLRSACPLHPRDVARVHLLSVVPQRARPPPSCS